MRKLNALFRVDVSNEVGLGHLMRSLALAEDLSRRGGDSFFVLGGASPEHVSLIEERGFVGCRVRSASGGLLDVGFTRALVHHYRAQICVIDGYRFYSGYFRSVSKGVPVLIGIDDLGQRAMPVDIVVNPNIGAESLSYPDARFSMLGTKYALLRSEFLKHHKKRVTPDGGSPRILLSFGGTDPSKSTARVLQNLPPASMRITAVIGENYQDDGELSASIAQAKTNGYSVELLRGVKDMASVMSNTDLAISAAGGTMLELSYFGVPTLAFAVAPNQERGGAAFGSGGYALYGGSLYERTDAELVALFKRLLLNKDKLSRTGSFKLVDGRGASRVIDAALGLLDQQASRLTG